MQTWDKLPLELMDRLAEKESYRRDVYRPIYSLHKWWARRPGSTFRILSLASFSGDGVRKEDILRETAGGSHEGLYLQDNSEEFEDATVLDPFSGGGTTLVEANRLGAETIGYELNPVAWWTIKKSIESVDIDLFKSKYQAVLRDVRDELDEYFHTKDPASGRSSEIIYTLQTQELPCLTCKEKVRLFPKYTLAKNTKKSVRAAVYCPNENCGDRLIHFDEDIPENVECPSCDNTFDPGDGNSGYGKYTCSQGHKHDIKETLNRLDEKPKFIPFALNYVTPDGTKKFKTLDEEDKKKITEAKELLDNHRDEFRIPNQKIPDGDKTKALLNYNYDSFNELYTDRHLLTYGKLFERSAQVQDDAVRELLITALSASLTRNSLLCKWSAHAHKGFNVFDRHAYVPKVQPIEGNPINRDENLVAVENFFKKALEAKKYCERPFEKIKNQTTGEVVQYYIQGEEVRGDRLSSLHCKTSEKIDLDDGEVDYIITDPPYYDNVQYSELSDYFYVWLREYLKDDYDEFKPELVPKAREIVANSKANKDEEFFVEGLSNVFSECHRVLSEDGEMVFTYHHNKNEAWSVILRAIIDSGFSITGAYPVQAEFPNNRHIKDLDNAEYDILIFANKDSTEEDITLTELRQNLFFELQDMISEERERHENLSQADLGVILRGKCMYYYSKHYPNVYSEGEQADIDEALDTVDSVIGQVLDSSVNLPTSIDPLTQAYAAFYQRGWEDFDELNKHLLAKNLNVSDLEDEKLVKGPRKKKEPVTADERVKFIEGKINKNGEDSDGLLDIDKVQYLYYLYKSDQNTREYLKEWKSEDLEELGEFMADVTGDERYENVMEMSLSQF